MRVLHVIASMDPSTGGPPAVASRLAAGQTMCLGQRGSVTILSHEAPGRAVQVEQSLRGIPNIEQVKFITVSANLKFGAIVPGESRNAVREHVANADVLHLHGVWDPLVRHASVEARAQAVPYVVTTHGMLDPWCLQQSWMKKKIALAVAYRSMLSHAGCLHLLNDDESQLIAPLKLPTPHQVIPNGVFLEEIEPLPAPGSFYAARPELRDVGGLAGAASAASAGGGHPYILFLSRLHYKKGLDYLADAFALVAAKHPSAHLVVAGPDDGAKADLESRIANAKLTDRVHIVGSIYGRDKYAAMVDAACFCLPSRQEGFSMAITESIACGTPVVISENCHFPEIATAGAGEVVALNARAVADALDRMLSDAARRTKMGAAGRELVKTRYTWPVIAHQAIQMYEGLRI